MSPAFCRRPATREEGRRRRCAGTAPPKHSADHEATTPAPPLAEALWATKELDAAAKGPEDGYAGCARRSRALAAAGDLSRAALASLWGDRRLLDGRDDNVGAGGGGEEDAPREVPQRTAASFVEAVISTHRLGTGSDAVKG